MFIDKSDNTYYSVPGSTDNAKKQGLIYDSQYFMTKQQADLQNKIDRQEN